MAFQQVVFNGLQYEVNNLNDEAKKLITLMKAGAEQINRAQAEIAIAEAGRAVISNKLEQLLKDVPSEATGSNED